MFSNWNGAWLIIKVTCQTLLRLLLLLLLKCGVHVNIIPQGCAG